MSDAVALIPPTLHRPSLRALGLGAIGGAAIALVGFGFGVSKFLIGVAGGCAAIEISRRRRLAKAIAAAEEEFPEAIEVLAESIRAKGSLRLGIVEVAESGPRRVAPAFQRAAQLLESGLSLEQALGGLFLIRDLPGAKAMDLALKIYIDSGGNLPAALDALAVSVRQRISIRRELEALTAQARLSSLILAGAPLIFAALSYFLGLGGRFLFGSFYGLMVLAAGLLLEIVGFIWVRRICAPRW